MIGQFVGHLAERREQIRERTPPGLENRIFVVNDVESDLTRICVDHGLDTVADIVVAIRQPGLGRTLHFADRLAVRITTRGRVPVDYPNGFAIHSDRVWVCVVGQKGCELVEAIVNTTNPEHLRVVLDCSGANDVVIKER